MKEHYADINARAVNQWVSEDWEWGRPVSHETYMEARTGTLKVVLTPQKAVPTAWFRPYWKDNRFNGVKILGLASGGGQQMPIFAALGGDVTVLDYADSQLASEKAVANREGYDIQIVKADMSKPLPFADNTFDLIFHPVSNCYVEDVRHVWREAFRVLKDGGLMLAGMDNGISYLFDDLSQTELKAVNKLPYNPLKNPDQLAHSMAIDGSIQFSHTAEDQIGGQLEAGFLITHLYEDRDNSLLGTYIPQYTATRSIALKSEQYRAILECRSIY